MTGVTTSDPDLVVHTGRDGTWGAPGVASVSLALARRSLANVLRIPAAFVPILAMPIFFVIAFSGSFTALTRLPAFPTDDMKSWVVPFATLQGAAFAGFGTGFGTVRDIETGLYDRFVMAPVRRLALLLGAVLAALARATFTVAVVVAFGIALGTEVPGGVAAIAALWMAALGIAVVSTGWALGIVYRMPDTRSGPILQIGIFFAMFLSTGLVPLDAQTGWVQHVARWNPITQVLDLARQGFIGDLSWAATWPGLVALAGMAAVLWTFAATGLRRLTP